MMDLWSKIWKSLAALAIVYGVLTPTGFTLKYDLWGFILVAIIFLVMYWHFLKKFYEKIAKIKKYFLDLEKDVKYIKKKVDKK